MVSTRKGMASKSSSTPRICPNRMRIRQPLGWYWQITLGVLSIVGLILLYAWLANVRQASRRSRAATELVVLQEKLDAAERELQALSAMATDSSDPQIPRLQGEVRRLKSTIQQRESDPHELQDRSVPTWRSLYRDGLRRVLEPEGLKKDEYWLREDAWATAGRLLGGLGLGVLLSVILGLAMGCYTWMEAICVPPLSFLAKIPPTAMLAVFFVLVGTTYPMYVTMIAFGTLPTLAQAIHQAAKKDVPDELIYKAYTLGASQMELVWNVVFRQILPRLIDAVRLQVGPAMVLLIAAEWMVAGEGFGYRLRLFFQRTDMTVVFVYLIILGVVGLLIDYALIGLRRWLCPWFGE